MNGNRRHRVGDAGTQGNHPSHIRRIGRLAHASNDYFFDPGGINPSARHQKPEGSFAQIDGFAIRQSCAGSGKRSSYTVHNVNRFFYKRPGRFKCSLSSFGPSENWKDSRRLRKSKASCRSSSDSNYSLSGTPVRTLSSQVSSYLRDLREAFVLCNLRAVGGWFLPGIK